MKKIYFILLATLFSCTSTENTKKKSENVNVWKIHSYTIDNKEIINSKIKEAFLVYNDITKKNYITFLLSDKETETLEVEWQKRTKKLELDKVYIVYEINYKFSGSKIELQNVYRDFVIQGVNTEYIRDDINKIVYAERRGETTGLIPLLYRIWNPNVIDNISYPILKKGDSFIIQKDNEIIKLNSDKTVINLGFIGVHQWIGY